VIKIQNIKKLMDFDSLVIKEEEKNEEDSKAKISDRISNDRNVFKPARFRRDSVDSYKTEWQYFKREFNFVLACGILFWIIFLFFWT
jgi:hypothetical protein